MRLLMTADTLGGTWVHAIELAAGLAVHGVRTTLATMGRLPTAAQCRAAAAVPGLSLKASRFALEWMDDPWQDVEAAGRWLLDLADEARPDVVQIHGFAHAALPFRAPVVAVAHACEGTRWRAVRGEDLPERYVRYREHVTRGLDAASAVVTPTRALLDAMEGVYGLSLTRARVIPQGIEASRFSPRASKDGFVLAAGRRWDSAKNLLGLTRVAERVAWPIRIAGDWGPSDEGGARSVRWVDLLGRLPREALAVCMSRASILCHPVAYEPFGLVPLEAASSGCALVLSDLPSLREIWGDAAVYVPAHDVAGMALALGRLIDLPDERRALASRAQARAAGFDRRRQVASYLGLYQDLVPGVGSERPKSSIASPARPSIRTSRRRPRSLAP